MGDNGESETHKNTLINTSKVKKKKISVSTSYRELTLNALNHSINLIYGRLSKVTISLLAPKFE